MRNLLQRLGLTIALAASLGAAAQQAKPAPQAAEPLISDCKTISCLRNLLRGAEGPPGPRGPAGRSAVQDVYAGSVRLGRLLAIDGFAQCSSQSNNRAEATKVGLLGLVETSTGFIVHLCIGAKFDFPSAGSGLGGLVRGFEAGTQFFTEPGCTGPLFILVTTIGNREGISLAGTESDGRLGGMFGPVMGKPRVAILNESDLLVPNANSSFYRFAIIGPPVLMAPKSYTEGGNRSLCRSIPTNAALNVYAQVTPNEPSITGLPNEPQTPYVLVDAQ